MFNRFKTLYRQFKEFYFFYEASINKLEKTYTWNYELIVEQSNASASNHNEYFDLVNRISHLTELARQLRTLVADKCLFEYNSETATTMIATATTTTEDAASESINESSSRTRPESFENDAYQYEYDNSTGIVCHDDDVGDYCTIDDEEKNDNQENKNSQVSQNQNFYCLYVFWRILKDNYYFFKGRG